MVAAAALALGAGAALAPPAVAQDAGGATTTTTAGTTAATPAVDGPVSGPLAADAGSKGHPLTAATDQLGAVGYQEQEVLLSGTATLHGRKGTWGADGRWSTIDVGTVPFRTRLLVRRPVDPAAFHGTVYVSWFDDGQGFDSDAGWAQVGDEVVREGAAWVGVSAQPLGVEGPLGAREWDGARYSSLDLTDDAASYDVFTQAAAAIRRPGSVDPLGGLGGERRLIATGQSQAAQRLVTYANAFQPATEAFDGFLLVSRFRGAAPLGASVLPPAQVLDPDGSGDAPYLPDPLAALLSGPPVAKVRSDLDVPVFTVLTETESRQDRKVTSPDGERSRTWEIAGSTHMDATATDQLVAQLARDFPSVPRGQLACAQANDFPARYALRAAVRAMSARVADGTRPPTAPALERDDASGALLRDPDGNAKGGLRLPQIEVPMARYSGESEARGYCGLTGSTVPFTKAQLDRRYPTPEDYVRELTAAIATAEKAGYLLKDDASELLTTAAVPGTTATAAQIASGEVAVAPEAPSVDTGQGGGAEVAAPSSGAAAGGTATAGAKAAAAPPSGGTGWMATTGRDLLTPLLAALLLLLNAGVVLTVARQRRRPSDG
jgi:hypothetical protein